MPKFWSMHRLKSKIKTPAASQPVTVDMMRQQLRLGNDTTHDALLTRYIKTATNWAQNSTGRIFMPTTLVGYMPDLYPAEDIEITNGPVQSVSSIKIFKEGVEEAETVDPMYYELDNTGLTAYLIFKPEFECPTLQTRFDAVQIEFISGYADADSVPPEIQDGIIMRAARLFTHPEDGVDEKDSISDKIFRDFKVPSV